MDNGNNVKTTRRKRIILIGIALLVVITAIVASLYLVPYSKYRSAEKAYNNNSFGYAMDRYKELEGFKDSREKYFKATYKYAKQVANDFPEEALGELKNTVSMAKDYRYELGNEYYELLDELNYSVGINYMENGEMETAIDYLIACDMYKDAKEYLEAAQLKSSITNIKWYVQFPYVGLTTDGFYTYTGREIENWLGDMTFVFSNEYDNEFGGSVLISSDTNGISIADVPFIIKYDGPKELTFTLTNDYYNISCTGEILHENRITIYAMIDTGSEGIEDSFFILVNADE